MLGSLWRQEHHGADMQGLCAACQQIKAKVFKKYSASFPCYSLVHAFEFETEEYKVYVLNNKPVVRNEITMVYLFPALRARPVVKRL